MQIKNRTCPFYSSRRHVGIVTAHFLFLERGISFRTNSRTGYQFQDEFQNGVSILGENFFFKNGVPIWSPGRNIPTQKIPKCSPGYLSYRPRTECGISQCFTFFNFFQYCTQSIFRMINRALLAKPFKQNFQNHPYGQPVVIPSASCQRGRVFE